MIYLVPGTLLPFIWMAKQRGEVKYLHVCVHVCIYMCIHTLASRADMLASRADMLASRVQIAEVWEGLKSHHRIVDKEILHP